MCQPAAALIISKGGEVEVVSRECSAAITTFSKFAGSGQSLSLLDEELLIIGNDDLGTKQRYISIQKPRDGLLAMKYTVEELPLSQVPHRHSSLVSGNTLRVIGGKFKSRGKLSKFIWTDLALKWTNGAKYFPEGEGACSIQLTREAHLIFGGKSKQVVKINTTEEIVYEMQPMHYSRDAHDCQLLNKEIVLISGGLSPEGGAILPDELYNITTQTVVKVLRLENSLRRHHHKLIKQAEVVWALGGMDSNNEAPSEIAEFDMTTNMWRLDLNQSLHSTNTSELIITPFPAASLECVPNCECGIPKRKGRILAGQEAMVKYFLKTTLKSGILYYPFSWGPVLKYCV